MEDALLFYGQHARPGAWNDDCCIGMVGTLSDWNIVDGEFFARPFTQTPYSFSERKNEWCIVPRGVSFRDPKGNYNSIYFQRFNLTEQPGKNPGGMHLVEEYMSISSLCCPSTDKDVVPVGLMVFGPYTPAASQQIIYKSLIETSKWDWDALTVKFGDSEPDVILPRVTEKDLFWRRAVGLDPIPATQYSRVGVKPLATYLIPSDLDEELPEFFAHSKGLLVHLDDSTDPDGLGSINGMVRFLYRDSPKYLSCLAADFHRLLGGLKRMPLDFMIELVGYKEEAGCVQAGGDFKRYLILVHPGRRADYEYTGLVLGVPLAGLDSWGSKPMLSSAERVMDAKSKRLAGRDTFPVWSKDVLGRLSKATRSVPHSPDAVYPSFCSNYIPSSTSFDDVRQRPGKR